MSDDNDDQLLDEDGDDYDYGDLGEGDEEALLRDDGEEDGEPEGEDILELEAAQDDLEDTEIQDSSYDQHQNTQLSRSQQQCPPDDIDDDEIPSRNLSEVEEEEDDEDDPGESGESARGRFRSERNSSTPLKSNSQSYNDIPDSLDQVIPESKIGMKRGGFWGRSGRGRGSPRGNFSNFRGSNRGVMRGARGQPHGMGRNQRGNYHNQGSRPHGPNMNQNVGPHMPSMNQNVGPHMPSMNQNVGPHMPNMNQNVGPHMPNMNQNVGPHMPNMPQQSPHVGHILHGNNIMKRGFVPNFGPNRGPNSPLTQQGGSGMGPSYMVHNLSPNTGPPHMGPNMCPPNMGPPGMMPSIHNMGSPNMMANIRPDMGPPQVMPNFGHHVGSQNIIHNMGPPGMVPNMGHNMGPPGMMPNMVHDVGSSGMMPNMMPSMGHNMGPQMAPHMGGNMGPNFNLNIGPNMNSSSPNIQNPILGPGFRAGQFSHQTEHCPPIQRVIYNNPQSPQEQTLTRIPPQEIPVRPNTKIHVNRHFRGNMHGRNEVIPVWENTTSNHEVNYNQHSGSDWNQNINQHQHIQGSFQIPVDHQPPNMRLQNQLPQPQRQPPSQPQMPSHQRFQNPPGRGGIQGQSSSNKKQQQAHSPPKRALASSPGVVPRKQGRLDLNHGKFQAHNSNLHVVPTVDTLPVSIHTLPDTTTMNESQQNLDEDEDTRQYRLKIEEQKRIREKFLREKEERRVKAALQKQKASDPLTPVDNIKGHAARDLSNEAPIQSITTIVNRNPPPLPNQALRKHTLLEQQIASSDRSARVLSQSTSMPNPSPAPGSSFRGRGAGRGRGVPGMGPGRGRVMGRGGGKTATAISAPASSTPGILHGQTSSNCALANLTPVVGGRGGRIVLTRGGGSNAQRVVKASHEPNTSGNIRTVMEPSIGDPNEKSISTSKKVVVENLSNSTSETQLRMMCNCIGRVESINVDKPNQCAVIQFVDPLHASAFVKRYQRRLVDLSLINAYILND